MQSDRIMNLEKEMSFIPEDVKLKARARRDSIANQHHQPIEDKLEIENKILNERKLYEQKNINSAFGF